MEAHICTSAPQVPTVPERQAIKLPDQGAKIDPVDNTRRRAIIAGLMTSPQGALGTPSVSKPTLG